MKQYYQATFPFDNFEFAIDSTQAAAPIEAWYESDEIAIPFQTADAQHSAITAAKLIAEYLGEGADLWPTDEMLVKPLNEE